MAQVDIYKSFLGVISNSPAFPVSYPNSQQDQTGTHYQVSFLPVEIENIAVEYSGSQELSGIFQILLAIPLSTGKEDYQTASDDLRAKFPRGLSLNNNGQIAEVEKLYESSELQNDQWWIIPFSVEYVGFQNG